MNQRPCNRSSLLLSTAQLMDEMARPIAESNQIDYFCRPSFTLALRHTLQQQRETNVFEQVHCRQQIEKLKDESHPASAIFREGSIIGCV